MKLWFMVSNEADKSNTKLHVVCLGTKASLRDVENALSNERQSTARAS